MPSVQRIVSGPYPTIERIGCVRKRSIALRQSSKRSSAVRDAGREKAFEDEAFEPPIGLSDTARPLTAPTPARAIASTKTRVRRRDNAFTRIKSNTSTTAASASHTPTLPVKTIASVCAVRRTRGIGLRRACAASANVTGQTMTR